MQLKDDYRCARIDELAADVTADIIKHARVHLTAAQIKALRATPITLVPAVTGKRLAVLGAFAKLTAGTNVLSESEDNLAIRYAGSTVDLATIETTGFIDQAANTCAAAVIASGIVASSAAVAKALVITNNGDGEIGGNAAGDAALDVDIFYQTIE